MQARAPAFPGSVLRGAEAVDEEADRAGGFAAERGAVESGGKRRALRFRVQELVAGAPLGLDDLAVGVDQHLDLH